MSISMPNNPGSFFVRMPGFVLINTFEISAQASIRIVVDRQRITQAVMNLVQNAVEHTTVSNVTILGS